MFFLNAQCSGNKTVETKWTEFINAHIIRRDIVAEYLHFNTYLLCVSRGTLSDFMVLNYRLLRVSSLYNDFYRFEKLNRTDNCSDDIETA